MLLGMLNGMCVPSDRLRGHIKEVYYSFVGFDCNFKAMLAEDIAKILLNFRAIKIPHRLKVIRESLGFRIPRCGFQIPCLWIPDSKALTPDSTDQTLDSGLTFMGDNLLCLTGRCLSYAKTVVFIQSKIVVM